MNPGCGLRPRRTSRPGRMRRGTAFRSPTKMAARTVPSSPASTAISPAVVPAASVATATPSPAVEVSSSVNQPNVVRALMITGTSATGAPRASTTVAVTCTVPSGAAWARSRTRAGSAAATRTGNTATIAAKTPQKTRLQSGRIGACSMFTRRRRGRRGLVTLLPRFPDGHDRKHLAEQEIDEDDPGPRTRRDGPLHPGRPVEGPPDRRALDRQERIRQGRDDDDEALQPGGDIHQQRGDHGRGDGALPEDRQQCQEEPPAQRRDDPPGELADHLEASERCGPGKHGGQHEQYHHRCGDGGQCGYGAQE